MPALVPSPRALATRHRGCRWHRLALAHGAAAQPAARRRSRTPALDAALFYQLLIGEIELRAGEAGTAYQVLLDAARRTATSSCSGARPTSRCRRAPATRRSPPCSAWRIDAAGSLEALRYQVQLLVALNRASETLEPLTRCCASTPGRSGRR